MLFQGKVDRAMKKSREDRAAKDENGSQVVWEPEKEKLEWKDHVAMLISALMVFLPAALIVLLLLAAAGYFFFVH